MSTQSPRTSSDHNTNSIFPERGWHKTRPHLPDWARADWRSSECHEPCQCVIKHQRTIYSSHFGSSNYSAHTHIHQRALPNRHYLSQTISDLILLGPHVQVRARVMCEHTSTAMVDEMFHPYNALPYISTRSAPHKNPFRIVWDHLPLPELQTIALRPTNQRQRGTPNGYGKRTRIAASESGRQTLNSHITKRTTIFQCNKAYLVPWPIHGLSLSLSLSLMVYSVEIHKVALCERTQC